MLDGDVAAAVVVNVLKVTRNVIVHRFCVLFVSRARWDDEKMGWVIGWLVGWQQAPIDTKLSNTLAVHTHTHRQ